MSLKCSLLEGKTSFLPAISRPINKEPMLQQSSLMKWLPKCPRKQRRLRSVHSSLGYRQHQGPGLELSLFPFPPNLPNYSHLWNKNYSPMRAKVWASSQSKVKCCTGANNYFNECVHPHISHSAGKTKQNPKNNVGLIRKLTTFAVESLVTGNAFKPKSVFGFTRMVNG